jgi:hypothetical protein
MIIQLLIVVVDRDSGWYSGFNCLSARYSAMSSFSRFDGLMVFLRHLRMVLGAL